MVDQFHGEFGASLASGKFSLSGSGSGVPAPGSSFPRPGEPVPPPPSLLASHPASIPSFAGGDHRSAPPPQQFLASTTSDSAFAGAAASTLRAAVWARASQRLNFDGEDVNVVRLSEDAAMELIRKLAVGITHSVQQIIPLTESSSSAPASDSGAWRRWRFGQDPAGATDFYQAVSQNLAKLGRAVERIYLVPPGGIRAEAVANRVSADGEMGVESRSLRVSEIDNNKALASLTPVSPVWIVDNSAVMYEEASEHGPTVWTVSARTEDVQRANDLWKQLWSQTGDTPVPASPELDLSDPLVMRAEQMAVTASMSCTLGNGNREPCGWYHGAWPYLRLFNMVSSPQWHHDFYRNALLDSLLHSQKQGRQNPRVLISGAADYSILAYVLDAIDRAPSSLQTRGAKSVAAPSVEVLDLCQTPLLTCRWYAGMTGHDVQVHEADICDPRFAREMAEKFDLITTDAFLTRFSAKESAVVIKRWRQLLAPGGRVITTVNLHTDGGDGWEVRSDDIAAFTGKARLAARRWRSFLRAGVEEIAHDALEYAQQITSTDLGGKAEVEALFRNNGFDSVVSQEHDVPGEFRPTRYLQVVATKTGQGRPVSPPRRRVRIAR